MDLISLLVYLVIFCVIGYLAYWIVTHMFPEPMKVAALAIVGVIGLIVLLGMLTGYFSFPPIHGIRPR